MVLRSSKIGLPSSLPVLGPGKDETYPVKQEQEAEGFEGCGYEEDSGPLSSTKLHS